MKSLGTLFTRKMIVSAEIALLSMTISGLAQARIFMGPALAADNAAVEAERMNEI